jgi:hypothetical protein
MIDPNLREQLLAFETETPSLKEKYRKEIQTMLEKELTVFTRIEMYAEIIFGAIMFFGALIAVVLFAIFDSHFSFLMGCIMALVSLFGMAGVLHGSWTLYQGKINIKQDRMVEMTTIWSFGGLIFFLFMLNGACTKNPAEGTLIVLNGFPILFILVLATLHRFIEKTGLELKEHILRLELHIAELNEKINLKPETDKKE